MAGHVPKSPGEFKVLLVYPNLPLMLVPPVSIAIFTAILKRSGYQIELFDATCYVEHEEITDSSQRAKYLQARRYDEKALYWDVKKDLLGDFRRKVESFRPDVLLVSILEDTWPQSQRLLATVSDLEIPTLVGGVFPTFAPEKLMAHPAIRTLCVGEGENVLPAFCENIRLGKPVDHIPNLWVKEPDGTITRNPAGPLVNISEIPIPDFSLFDEARFYRPMGPNIFKTIPVETFRGCPFKCTFCNSPGQVTLAKEEGIGTFTRRKRMERLAEELRVQIQRYSPEFVFIYDDSFLARPTREILEFSKMYEEFRLPFWCQTRVETVSTERLAALKRVGCYRMSYGIEHGNEEYRRKILDRNISNRAMLEKFEIIARAGIPFSVNTIIGHPYETRELVFDSIEFARQIADSYDSSTVSIFTPYHGTVLREVALKAGWLDPDAQSSSRTSRSLLRMPPPYLSADDIAGLARTFSLYAKFPKERWGEIRAAEALDAEGEKAWERLASEYNKIMWGGDEALRRSRETPVTGGTGCRASERERIAFEAAE